MSNFVYPTAAELSEIEQVKLPVLTMADPVFSIFPIVNKNTTTVMWEQQDNYTGLQQLRGLNGEAPRVNRTGGKRYIMLPGVYGEKVEIKEDELTQRRNYGDFSAPIDITDLVVREQDRLLSRRIDRIRQIAWNVIQGSFSVSGENGIIHADQFPVQGYAANVPWGTVATATPLQDFRNVQLLSQGRSVSFGSNAKAYMNRRTFNNLTANLNQSDLAGKRMTGLAQPLGFNDINQVLGGEALPQLVVHDEGYLDDDGVFQNFIPNNRVIVVGVRPGAKLGEYQMVRNATNPNMEPGAYTRVWDSNTVDGGRPPRLIEVHDGHNGGPALMFPGDIVLMTV